MFHGYYATTRDRKGNEHNYKLPAGEGVPSGHEITNLSVASQHKLLDLVDEDTAYALAMLSSKGRVRRAKA